MATCKLHPGTNNCRFDATPGSVTLSVQGTVGEVLFESASYKGHIISGLPASSITFAIEAGTGDLDVVYAFGADNGQGVLKETCDAGAELDRPSVGEPFQRYRICAEELP